MPRTSKKKAIDQVRIVIDSVSPSVSCGRLAAKASLGEAVEVAADIWKDGHELLRAAVLWRKLDTNSSPAGLWPSAPNLESEGWHEVPMRSALATNDRWYASFAPLEVGAHAFTVVAWTDAFGSFCEDLRKRLAAEQNVASELLEGMELVDRAVQHAQGADKERLARLLARLRAAKNSEERARFMLAEDLGVLMARCDPRADLQCYAAELPLWVDRERARLGAWYEIFVRSQGMDPSRSATFREAEARLPAIAAMGFDVLYLAPIHPIGESHRKGPNNSETCRPGDPGSPWAIGSAAGGHTAVHPELGTLADFDHFVQAAQAHGLELALDFAVQCSPDHPWVQEHPEWFSKRPDGTIKYAENPPKKYQDIYPINFDSEDRAGLYQALLDAALFWIKRGVRILRVDNPHTKAVSFWQWFIARIQAQHPDVIFLAEAFTRPKRMKMLAKVGYTQSYSYFTWRNSRKELEEYATELFLTDVADYLRPNFFANTPDILHEYLQKGGRPAFITRLILAATLSPSYGIYSGFELCENRAVKQGSEEYLDSEKYQVRVWDWNRPGNINHVVTLVNRIRREHPALAFSRNLVFLESSNPNIIAYAKFDAQRRDVLVMVVNLDPYNVHDGTIRLASEILHPVDRFDPDAKRPALPWTYAVSDLLTGARYDWRNEWNYVRLDPQALPAHILKIEL